jgi:hypothetical protein
MTSIDRKTKVSTEITGSTHHALQTRISGTAYQKSLHIRGNPAQAEHSLLRWFQDLPKHLFRDDLKNRKY